MSYFVTGATGFIGRRLVRKLLDRGETVYVLVRARSTESLAALPAKFGAAAERVVPVVGDLTQPRLGVGEADLARLRGQVEHFFHLAAVYDLRASAESMVAANVEGTRNAVALAAAVEARCFHHTSSIAAAGLYEGTFREDMFEEAEGLEHPYYATKHESERVVREECTVPWRVYRPAIVVGSAETGEMDKIDGPYFLFKFIQKLRSTVPPWMPTIGLEGGRLNMVPVNFVVDAMDHIAHREGLDGRCFHLTDPAPMRVGDMLNVFARAAHAPQMTMRINAAVFNVIPASVRHGLAMLAPVRRIRDQILGSLGIPPHILQFVNYPTRFDCRETLKALEGTEIRVPPLEDYAWKLWDYWERHLDPDLYVDRTLSGRVKGKVAMVTGASSGIGLATALRLAAAGAKVVLVARGEEQLLATKAEIERRGGTAFHYVCDLAEMEQCDRLVDQVSAEHGGVDFLVNNAGRSIRRAIALSFDRFHDFERTMQLNYFGSLRVTLGFLPGMMERKRGHIVNISSIGVLSNAPRFSAYVASKSALDAFSRCAAAEFADSNIHFTTINMPLVRTPMIAPTKIYEHVPTLSPEEAADLVAQAIIYRQKRIATRLGIFAQVAYAVAPKVMDTIMNAAFKLFQDSAAARGDQPGQERPSNEQMAFAALMRGIHW